MAPRACGHKPQEDNVGPELGAALDQCGEGRPLLSEVSFLATQQSCHGVGQDDV